ncbi:hypothetical protein BDV26DRAFT_274679 [Aspergillus bertholletiae]|uniref:HNH nuclease domain-containing protein n=1 Tax=Aspergillus bertholletiae TaxID=1226010 RepID=A0A5N7AR15_9EURO|nr:hypothetical protein BDV26DRAFT_274679 [Aspergillus bertholletiae]
MIQFLHPGYPDHETILLILPAFDTSGVHHETARIACALLANCRWDGYLSSTPSGTPVGADRNEMLTGPIYYFCIEGETDYPIVPSFDNFHFPSILPDSWAEGISAPIQPAISDRVPDRDRTCRVTCSSLPNEIAHIIPAFQEGWWLSNSMFVHTSRPANSLDTSCPANAILLRRDVHYLWDQHRFSIVPKQRQWVLHVLSKFATDELQERYHNLELLPLIGVARQFLLAQFALTIFADQNMFPVQGNARRLIILQDKVPHTKVFSGKDCIQLFGPSGKSRSRSPKKRQRSAARENEGLVEPSWSDNDDPQQDT